MTVEWSIPRSGDPLHEPLVVRLVPPPPGEPLRLTRVVDEVTGEDLSRRFPVTCCRRLYRALESGRPTRLSVFRLSPDGTYLQDGSLHLARELVTVFVSTG